ncbi:extracellular solute-binding protein [Undibacterium sp. Jales W-56]|uniref:extracellular solute-binding protein n=1 Tax=Undibacterium sp. Jales W-56 TaxID=2897325 RepID=UPI0021CFDFCB|nr:extracellular solute-binding protein [Undibacterium sp. Jales W-56]MCU6433248.1 extracellular solute-binding protein [Undibacterium sp. Jales W-56]
MSSLVCQLSLASEKLRLLTWADYAPREITEQFTKETGITVEVTISNNEEMISKLRATGGAGFDLVQPSQDRIVGPLSEFGIYKPIDFSKINTDHFLPEMLESAKKVTTFKGKYFGVPFFWGTDGLVVNSKAKITDYSDLCKPEYLGKVAVRLKRPTLIGIAFSMGQDPFKAYNNPKQYEQIMQTAGEKMMSCKKNYKYFWESKDQLLNDLRSGELVAAQMWDSGGWKLNAENPLLRFVAPKSGALGWVDSYALPSKGKNDAAAYAWINFVSRPEIAARMAKLAGSFTAVKGAENFMDPKMKSQLNESFSPEAFKNIKWYPSIPPGLEEIDGKILDRVKASF